MSRRSGGRAARVALRAAPLAEDLRPIRPGLKGGQYKPLDDAGVQRIHEAALDALETIGLAQAPQSGVDAMTEAEGVDAAVVEGGPGIHGHRVVLKCLMYKIVVWALWSYK